MALDDLAVIDHVGTMVSSHDRGRHNHGVQANHNPDRVKKAYEQAEGSGAAKVRETTQQVPAGAQTAKDQPAAPVNISAAGRAAGAQMV